mmetsp:Transcript_915/g.2435  ORF Transcript_915/g.2435 Transcript_915/m.2435 type:complete len:295 (-) Transcript_915:246-1130(-)
MRRERDVVLHAGPVTRRQGLPARRHVPPEPRRARLLRRPHHRVARAHAHGGDCRARRRDRPVAAAPLVAAQAPARAQPRSGQQRRRGEEPVPRRGRDGVARRRKPRLESGDRSHQGWCEATAGAADRRGGLYHRVDARRARRDLADRDVHAVVRGLCGGRRAVRLGLLVRAPCAPGLRRCRRRERRGRWHALGRWPQHHQRHAPQVTHVRAAVADSGPERADGELQGADHNKVGGQVQADAPLTHPRWQCRRRLHVDARRAAGAHVLWRARLRRVARTRYDQDGRAAPLGQLWA